MGNPRYFNNAFTLPSPTSTDVQIQPFASITVQEPGTSNPLVQQLLDANGNPKSNPFVTDQYGNIEFYLLNPQRVRIVVAGTPGLIADYEPVFPDPIDLVKYSAPNTINDLSVNLPITGVPEQNQKNFDVKVDGIPYFRVWGGPGFQNGYVSIHGGMTIKDDGLYDQSPMMFKVEHNHVNLGAFGLANITMKNQLNLGDSLTLGIGYWAIDGVATDFGTSRSVDFEVWREYPIATQRPGGMVLLEGGLHPGGRLPGYMDALGNRSYRYIDTVPDPDVIYSEGVRALVGIFLFAASEAWAQTGANVLKTPVDYKVPPHGTALWIGGSSQWDTPIAVEDETLRLMLELDHTGRFESRPESFTDVWYFNGSTTLSYLTAANRTQTTSSDTVPMPLGGGQFLYLGSTAPIDKIHFRMSDIVNTYAGTATLLCDFWNGSGFFPVSTNMAANGSVFTDGTNDGTGPFRKTGDITFGIPPQAVPGVPSVLGAYQGNRRYWIRLAIGTVASSTNGAAHVVRPGLGAVGRWFSGADDTIPAVEAGSDGIVMFGRGYKFGDLGVATTKRLTGSATWDPPSLAHGSMASTNITVTGAVTTDKVKGWSFSSMPNVGGWFVTAFVSSASNVIFSVYNFTGSTVNLGSGTIEVTVEDK